METVSGVSNWRLVLRREPDGVAILRAGTPDARAVLPDRLFGLPVTALGDRALAPERQGGNALPAGAEAVLVSCIPPEEGAAWDNRGLRDLALPETLRAMGDYALLNCSALKTLRIYDGVTRWGGGVLMNCRSLDALRLTRTGPGQGEALAWFAGELSRELDVTVCGPGGETARLLFPEYTELYEENCPAHHFDYFISGAGYPYRHCFRQKRLSLKEYDALWRDFLGMEHDEAAALRLAWRRLRWPADLGDEAAADYRAYLKDHAGEALRLLLEERDAESIPFLLELARPDRETLSAACALAREAGATAALAALLEEQHRRFPAGAEKSFAL
ncbi:MAG: leucine-rich repeat domain-containing protein [Dysosmobacter sp.]|nr:leucine-rich repeat domain-containing protein [Dysosmobacter sp.]